MEEFVVPIIKYKYKAYLLTKRTKLSLCNVKDMFCKQFSCVIVKAKNGAKGFRLHNKQWPLLAQWKTMMGRVVPWGGPLYRLSLSCSGVLSSAFSGVSSIQNLNASPYQEQMAELMRGCQGLPGAHDSSSSPCAEPAATLTFLRAFLGAPHNPRSSCLRI